MVYKTLPLLVECFFFFNCMIEVHNTKINQLSGGTNDNATQKDTPGAKRGKTPSSSNWTKKCHF